MTSKKDRFNPISALWNRYFKHTIPSASAELAYNLLFAVFPMIIFIHMLLIRLGVTSRVSFDNFGELFPSEVISVLKYYVDYIDRVPELRSGPLFIGIIIFVLVTLIVTVNNSSRGVRKAFGINNRPGIFQFIWVIALVFMLILSVVLMVILYFIGGNFAKDLSKEVSWITPKLLSTLKYYVFPIYIFLNLSLFYCSASLFKIPFYACMPGAGLTIILWCGVSYVFTYYVTNFAKYSVFYGSIGSLVVFMLWLFLLANVFLIGAEFNAVLFKDRREIKE